MTIDEFRKRINTGPSVEELRTGFEDRITEIANRAVDERSDIRELKNKIEHLEKMLTDLENKLNAHLSPKTKKDPFNIGTENTENNGGEL